MILITNSKGRISGVGTSPVNRRGHPPWIEHSAWVVNPIEAATCGETVRCERLTAGQSCLHGLPTRGARCLCLVAPRAAAVVTLISDHDPVVLDSYCEMRSHPQATRRVPSEACGPSRSPASAVCRFGPARVHGRIDRYTGPVIFAQRQEDEMGVIRPSEKGWLPTSESSPICSPEQPKCAVQFRYKLAKIILCILIAF